MHFSLQGHFCSDLFWQIDLFLGCFISCYLFRNFGLYASMTSHKLYSKYYKKLLLLLQVSHAWQNLPTDKFDPDFIERRRAALEVFLSFSYGFASQSTAMVTLGCCLHLLDFYPT